MYTYGRYFTVTGEIFGSPRRIAERSEEFLEVYERYFGESESVSVSASAVAPVKTSRKPKAFVSSPRRVEVEVQEFELSDEELLERMFKSKNGVAIERLFQGDWSGYPSQSEADLALVSHLVYWTQGDVYRVDKLFRQSGLMRAKWERGDYRSATIDLALRTSVNTYEPRKIDLRGSSVENLGELSKGSRGLSVLSETEGQDVAYYLENEFNADTEKFEKHRAMKTGFSNLDKIINLYPGLYVLGAISSLGKTTFACQLADQLAKSGEYVLFFSLEQSKFELVSKGLSRLTAEEDMKTAVSSIRIREGERTASVLRAVEEYKKFGKRNVIYQCGFEANISTILDRVKNYIEDRQVKPVVTVDYLQIVRPVDIRTSTKEAVDENVRALKKMQVEQDLVVLLISSLNRANYLTPVDFESFKESGGIEYTADVIWGLQLSVMNDELFDKEKNLKSKRDKVREAKKTLPREVELVCLKNRYGVSSYVCKFDYYAQYDYFVPSNEGKKSDKSPVRY